VSEHVVDVGTDLRGGGKLGSSPGASTTKGPPQKNSKKYYLKFINSFFVFRFMYLTSIKVHIKVNIDILSYYYNRKCM